MTEMKVRTLREILDAEPETEAREAAGRALTYLGDQLYRDGRGTARAMLGIPLALRDVRRYFDLVDGAHEYGKMIRESE